MGGVSDCGKLCLLTSANFSVEVFQAYSNCSCIQWSANDSSQHWAEDSICVTSSCGAVVVFSVAMFVVMVALFMIAAMNISGITRYVSTSLRTLPSSLPTHAALSPLQQRASLASNSRICHQRRLPEINRYPPPQLLVFVEASRAVLIFTHCACLCCFAAGTVPAPVLFGYTFDASCIMWEEVCGERGNCFYFDKQQLGVTIALLCFAYKLVSVICLVLAWKLYKPPLEKTDIVLQVTPASAPADDDVKVTSNGQVFGSGSVLNEHKLPVSNGGAHSNEDMATSDCQISRL